MDLYAVAETLRNLFKQRPFKGVELVIADGRLVKIDTPEQAWIDSESDFLYVVRLKPADEPLTEIISIRHIAMIRVRERLTPDRDR